MGKRDIENKKKKLLYLIKNKKRELINVLLNYESYETTRSEINNSIKTLNNLDKEIKYISSIECNSISVFLPINLPLYSFVLYSIVPAFMSKNVFVRIPDLLSKTLDDIFNVLDIEKLFPNIKIIKKNKTVFVEAFASISDVVIFTGKYKNANIVKEKCKNSLFLYNGAGVNPFVITKNANVGLSVKKLIKVRIFNSGQDCAAPNVIFINQKIYQKFIDRLYSSLDKIKIGLYKDKKVRVGKLINYCQIPLISNFFYNNKEEIKYGGIINFKEKIIYPTVIENNFLDSRKFIEFFSPVFNIVCYKTNSEIKKYLSSKEYSDYAMYISLFGESKLFKENKFSSIILKNKSIEDVEDANSPYGGYGKKSNFIYYKGEVFNRPILISKEIYN